MNVVIITEGPNDTWSVAGNDKMSHWHFDIHLCQDAYSRFNVWLEHVPTNSDPFVVANLYLNAVEVVGGIPKKLVCDKGTENGLMYKYQLMFGGQANYSSSPHNQRAESFNNQLHTVMDPFVKVFTSLENEGVLDVGNAIQMFVLRLVFGRLFSERVGRFRDLDWNLHRIRKQRNTLVPHGVPTINYHNPEKVGGVDQLLPVDPLVLAFARTEVQQGLNARAAFDQNFEILTEMFTPFVSQTLTLDDSVNVFKYIVSLVDTPTMREKLQS